MDPDACLDDIRTLVIEWREAAVDMTNFRDHSLIGDELVDKVQSLDEWIARYGFLPSQWVRRSQPTLEDIDLASDLLGALLTRFSNAVGSPTPDRSLLRGILTEIVNFATSISDGIALGGFPEVPRTEQGDDRGPS